MKISVIGCWGLGTIGETTSFLIDIEDITILIDFGLSPARQMKSLGRSLTEINFAVISHTHADHLQGLPYALFVRSVQERTFGKALPLKIISHPTGLEAAQILCKTLYPDRPPQADYIVIDDGETISLSESVQLKALSVDHTVQTYAYRLSSHDQSITFTADTCITESLARFAKDTDVLICEAFGTLTDFGEPAKKMKHMLAIDAGLLANLANAKNLLLFHMHEKYYLPENRLEILAEVKTHYSGPTIFPDDLNVYNFD